MPLTNELPSFLKRQVSEPAIQTERVWTKEDKLAFCLSQLKNIATKIEELELEVDDTNDWLYFSHKYTLAAINAIKFHKEESK